MKIKMKRVMRLRQPVQGYFMPKGYGIVIIVHLYLHTLYSGFFKGFLYSYRISSIPV